MEAHILLVENKDSQNQPLMDALASIGIDLSISPHSQETLLRITRGPRPDLILLDQASCAARDSEVERHIHMISRVARIPLVGMTANLPKKASTPVTSLDTPLLIPESLPSEDKAFALRIVIEATRAAPWLRQQELGPCHAMTAESLLDATSEYLPELAHHSRRVARLCVAIAKQLSLSEQDCQKTLLGALLHDIGKICIDRNMIRRRGPLQGDDFSLMQQHVQMGGAVVAFGGFPSSVIRAVREHHENFDGTGYPAGLAGNAILPIARIIRVADAFDAMITARPYRPARSPQLAVAELRYCSGGDFDPDVVLAVEELVKRGVLFDVDSNNGTTDQTRSLSLNPRPCLSMV
jgi:putative nucleotidyltransferase with HDIG domain